MAKLMDRLKAAFKGGSATSPAAPVIDKAVLTQEIAAAETSGVRSPITGYPADGLTPVRLGAIMRAADQGDPLSYFELAEQAEERDPHYTAVLGKRKRQVAKIPIRVEAASDATHHVAQADYVRKWLKRDTLKAELFDMLDAVGKGISFTEIIWDSSNGHWWPRRLEWRDPRFFTFDRTDLNTPLLREGAGTDRPLPHGKFIVTRIQAKSGLSIRSGVARAALWGWMFKMYTAKDWAVFLQTYGQPIRLGRYPSGASPEDKSKLLRAVTNIAGDCAAIVPQGMDIEFVEAKTQSQSAEHFERRANWLDQQTSKLVLGQTATTDAIAGGHAVGKEHREVEGDLAESDASALQAVLNEQLMRVWIDLEYGPQEEYPRFIIEEPDETDIPVLVDAVDKLSRLGVEFSKDEVRNRVGLKKPTDEDDTLRPSVPTADPPAGTPANGKDKPGMVPPARGGKARLMAAEGEPPEDPHEDDIADALEASSLDDWEAFIAPAVAQVVAEIRQATSLVDLRTRLEQLGGRMDMDTLQQALSDAQVTAHIAGLFGVPRKG